MGETVRILLHTANLGNFEQAVDPVGQSVPCEFHRFTDENFPPRYHAMTPRLQARIPKCWGWQILPGYDLYIWVDSSLAVVSPDTASWFAAQCEGVDACFFRHPDRATIHEEAAFIKAKVAEGNRYVTMRYGNELVDEELAEIDVDAGFVDDLLIHSCAFAYKPTDAAKAMLKEWWYGISRFHTVDQIALPVAIYRSGAVVRIIEGGYGQAGLRYSRPRGTRHNG
jgi:hypothetical protein